MPGTANLSGGHRNRVDAAGNRTSDMGCRALLQSVPSYNLLSHKWLIRGTNCSRMLPVRGVSARGIGGSSGCVCCSAAPTTEKQASVTGGSHNEASGSAYQSSAYPFSAIESKWRTYWEENQTFRTPEFKDLDTSKPKFYALDMFPYPR